MGALKSRPARNLRANVQSSWAVDEQQDQVDMAALEQFLGYPLRRAQLTVAAEESNRRVTAPLSAKERETLAALLQRLY